MRVNAVLIICVCLLSCKGETVYETQVVYADAPVCTYSEWCGELPVIEPPIIVEPIEPDIPMIPIEPPIIELPQLPEFYSDQVTIISQNPFEAVINESGNVWIHWDDEAEFIQDFVFPEWSVEYLYKPYGELIIEDGNESLCARFDFNTGKFGGFMPRCLWSSPSRDNYELEQLREMHHGFHISESRVWVNGVIDLSIHLHM